MRRPNVLLLMADQLTPTALPAYGNRVARTPGLDRLAAAGTVFDSAYCNYPICAPSRYSMLTGRLPHAIAAYDNAAELPAATPTLMHHLRRHGYRTTLAGKMHFVGPDQLHGYQERLNTDIYPADFAWVPDWRAGPRNAPTGISMRAVVEAGPCLRSLQIDYDDETAYLAGQKLYDLARGPRDAPFFLTVSLSHPHSPFTASQRHWDAIDHADVDMPRVGPLPLEQMDAQSRWLYYSHGRDRFTVTDDHVRNARHAYYAMIGYVDEHIGRLLRILDETGLRDSTLIVFASDHGEMLGERGMWYKQTFFENSARVPLWISGPGVAAGARIRDNVSLVDLVPTLLELVGADAGDLAAPWQGASLAPLLRGDAGVPARPVIAEYSDMGVCAPCRMVRQGDLKYVYVHGHAPLLFDLSSDPLERDDLHGMPAYAAQERALRATALDGWHPDDLHARILASQAERRLIRSVMSADASTNWSFLARPDDARRYVRGGGDQEGTVAVKGRARFPFVAPVAPDRAGDPLPEESGPAAPGSSEEPRS